MCGLVCQKIPNLAPVVFTLNRGRACGMLQFVPGVDPRSCQQCKEQVLSQPGSPAVLLMSAEFTQWEWKKTNPGKQANSLSLTFFFKTGYLSQKIQTLPQQFVPWCLWSGLLQVGAGHGGSQKVLPPSQGLARTLAICGLPPLSSTSKCLNSQERKPGMQADRGPWCFSQRGPQYG